MRPTERGAIARARLFAKRSAAIVRSLAGAFGVVCALLGSGASAAPARAARLLTVRDEGRLKLIKSSGSLLIDEGTASGTFPGRLRVRFVYRGDPTVSAQITIYGRDGSISAHATGHLSSLTSPSPSFKGTLKISGASGRYAGARGSGQLYGVFYRRTYAMTVQTRGTLSY